MFYGFKFVLDKFTAIMPLQFVEHILLAIFTYEIFAFLLSIEPMLRECAIKWWWKPVKFISSITLEIFLVMDYAIEIFEKLSFPVSLLVTVIAVWSSAWILHIIQNPISKKLSGMVSER